MGCAWQQVMKRCRQILLVVFQLVISYGNFFKMDSLQECKMQNCISPYIKSGEIHQWNQNQARDMKFGESIHKSFTKNLKHLLIRNQIFFLFIAISKSFYFFSLFITILMLFTLTEFTLDGVLSSLYSCVRPQKFLISKNIFGFLAPSHQKFLTIFKSFEKSDFFGPTAPFF